MAVNTYKLILASGSPRRKQILGDRGYEFEIIKSDNEELTDKSRPFEVVVDLSLGKAQDVLAKIKEDYTYEAGTVILAADTIVACDEQILGKPADRARAIEMISLIKGRAHQVYTGVTLIKLTDHEPIVRSFYEATNVYVKDMTMEQIEAYVDTGEGYDKAGGYAIQGIFGRYIERFEGDYENVVGLPGKRVEEELLNI